MGLGAPSLTDAIKAAAGRLPPARRAKPPRRPETSLSDAVRTVGRRKRNPPTTRAGRRGILIYFDQKVADEIRRVAADYDATNQELGEMAFKFLFEKFGEPWPGD
jgi:hypothetical protein